MLEVLARKLQFRARSHIASSLFGVCGWVFLQSLRLFELQTVLGWPFHGQEGIHAVRGVPAGSLLWPRGSGVPRLPHRQRLRRDRGAAVCPL